MPRKARTPRQKQHEVTLTTDEAADYVAMSEPWLRLQRRLGRGPAYLKIGGAVRYLRSDLDAWMATHRRVPGAA